MRNHDESRTSNNYVASINRAIDFVVQHLDRQLKLDDLAAVAHFSPFHFHRIFRSLVGETVNQFVKRLRLERAVRMLRHEPTRRLTEIALACGFGSSSDFSRCFKQRYGVPPSEFDPAAEEAARREEMLEAEKQDPICASHDDSDGVRDPVMTTHPHRLKRLPAGQNPDGFAVRMRERPARTVAYIRTLAPYREGAVTGAAERLVGWAEGHGLGDNPWYGYMWDDPDLVAADDCRYDVAVEIDAATAAGLPDREVGCLAFPAMLLAEVPMAGSIECELRALDWLFATWLPQSGFVPTDQPCFEAWCGRPFAHGTEHFELAIQLPVARRERRLR
ncbi:MAG: GyrI-like domain-containing protein [Planctomycetota bacterium]